MTRRLQLLLDDERMARLEQRAEAGGRSVASLIREAIDIAYPPANYARRQQAVERILAAPRMPVEDWAEMKRTERASFYGDEGPDA